MNDEYDRYRRAQAARWLEHVRGLGARVRAIQSEIDAHRQLAEGVGALRYDREGHAQPTADAIPDAVARIEEMVADYVAELAGFVEEQREAHEAISRLRRSEYSEALTRRYLIGQSWERICVDMGYSWDGMKTLRYRALSELYDLMPARWRDPVHQAI